MTAGVKGRSLARSITKYWCLNCGDAHTRSLTQADRSWWRRLLNMPAKGKGFGPEGISGIYVPVPDCSNPQE